MSWRPATLALAAGAALLVGCDRSAPASVEHRVTITGSSTAAPLLAEIARRFEARHPDHRVDVQTGGSSRGITDAMRGLADIGASSRPLAEEEDDHLEGHVVALDGVAFVVHATNDVPALNEGQLGALYRGAIERWSELGGPDVAVTAISRAQGRSELDIVLDRIQLEPRDVQADLIAAETEQALKLVEANPGAIVFVSLGAAAHAVRAGRPVRALALDDVPATTEQVRNGRYPLVRPLLLVTPFGRDDGTERFLRFALSSEVDDLVEDFQFVSPPR